MRNRNPKLPGRDPWRAVVLLVGVSLLLAACNNGADLETPEGARALPDDHIAAQLIADSAPTEEVAEAAFTCSGGGSSAGPIHTCLISDDGLLVIFPLTMVADVTGVITGSGFTQQFEVPLPAVSGTSLPDPGDLFAIPHDQGSIQVEFYYNDEPSGAAVSGPIEP